MFGIPRDENHPKNCVEQRQVRAGALWAVMNEPPHDVTSS
jgi:hypothetical protein